MKRVFIAFISILVVLFAGAVSAECQYKNHVGSGLYKSILYDKNGSEYENPIVVYDFTEGSSSGSECNCIVRFKIKNNIDKTISVNIQYTVIEKYATYDEERILNISPLKNVIISKDYPMCNARCYVDEKTFNYRFLTNNETTASIEEILNETSCKQCGDVDCLNDGQECTFDFECGSGVCSDSGNTIGYCIAEASDYEQRLSALETWKETITQTISDIWTTITGLVTQTTYNSKITELEARLEALESGIPFSNCGNNIREGDELCDGTDLNSKTCESSGYTGGTLACSSSCLSYDDTNCLGTLREHIKFRTTDLGYNFRSAIAFTKSCGSDLESYGYEYKRHTNSECENYAAFKGDDVCSSNSDCLIMDNVRIGIVPSRPLGDGVWKLYQDDRDINEVWLCQNDADGNGAVLVRYDKKDKDNTKVSDNHLSNPSTSGFEVKC